VTGKAQQTYEHDLFPDDGVGLRCAKCDLSWKAAPRSRCAGVPSFRSWDAVPKHLRTRAQLDDLGVKPGGPVRGAVTMYNNTVFYALFDANEALPIRSAKAASKRAAVAAGASEGSKLS